MSMRIAPATAVVFAACFAAGCAQLTQGGDAGSESTAAATGDGGADAAEAGVVGANCGVEGLSGAQLCIATTQCPTLVIDTQAFPHCGFRIKGNASELVCGCGESICSMGAFTTCAQAAQLLTSQTEGAVCTQVNEGRCTSSLPAANPPGSSSGSTCDRECLKDCGGAGGCASICGC